MRHQRLAHFGAKARHHVEYAGRKARFLGQCSQFQQRCAGELRRLEHHRVAPRQRRGQLPGAEGERRVPRRDGRHHAHGLVAHVVENARLVNGHHRALHLVGQACVVVKPLRDVAHLAAHFGHQLAVVTLLGFGQQVGVGLDQIGQAAQQGAALRGRQIAPRGRLQGGVR
ncbi:hypothetical protein SDC9_124704 [bioreactor metagenome]|uniref:Uncharacterized protein n=1 Tax=bioreactor metagenome TaxID=1076179 RepID=A0A645CL60_9ZZZZ